MWNVLVLPLLLLLLLLSLPPFCPASLGPTAQQQVNNRTSRQLLGGSPVVGGWVCAGHLDPAQLAGAREAPFEGPCVAGQAYTLVFEMPLEGQWDFVLDSCLCNRVDPFVSQSGCLRPTEQWVRMRQVLLDNVKFILIYFFAPSAHLRFECQARVVQCCGCCQNPCQGAAAWAPFPSSVVPVSVAVPAFLPPPPPAALPAAGPHCWLPIGQRCPSVLGLPWWALCLLALAALLLLVVLFCCPLALCLLAGWRHRNRIWAAGTKHGQPLPHPPARVHFVDESSQTSVVSGDCATPPSPPHHHLHRLQPPIPPPDYEQQRGQWAREGQRCATEVPLGEIGPKWWTREEVLQEEREEHEWAHGRNGEAAEERRHYENWGWPDAVFVDRSTGWTHFGAGPPSSLPVGGIPAAEEEDLYEWRRRSADGTVREGAVRNHRQKSAY